MPQAKVYPLSETHTVEVVLTDNMNHQHVMAGKLTILYRKDRYEVDAPKIPSEVLKSIEFEDCVLAFYAEAEKMGDALLEAFNNRTSPTGVQGNLFADFRQKKEEVRNLELAEVD